jgi:hypothetical protein
MKAKYNSKMEDIIQQRFDGSPDKQLDIAKRLLRDFKQLYSPEALVGMTPERIRDKYQSLRRYGPNDPTIKRERIIPVETVQMQDTFQERKGAVLAAKILKTSKSSKTATLKDRILDMLIDSDDMTISIKGTEVTVLFK